MRDVWRSEFDVAVYTLQEGIVPKDHAMFEQYWIDQFANLLNVAGNKPGKQPSAVAKQDRRDPGPVGGRPEGRAVLGRAAAPT